MGVETRPTELERAEAYSAALYMAKSVIREDRNAVHPNAKIGSLSDNEWRMLVEAIVSGWIIHRSKQLSSDLVLDGDEVMATGEVPEPQELGVASLALRPLGDLVEGMGLSDVPIGRWSKQQILLFIWTATELVNEARAKTAIQPPPFDVDDVTTVYAG